MNSTIFELKKMVQELSRAGMICRKKQSLVGQKFHFTKFGWFVNDSVSIKTWVVVSIMFLFSPLLGDDFQFD